MAERFTASTLLTTVKEGLLEIGYRNDLLQENYSFVDVFAQDQPLRQIELAAFAHEPASYRNACIGIVVPSYDGSDAIMNYKALGAPQILALHPEGEKIQRWKILAQGKPVLIESIEPAHLREAILAHQTEWNPEQVLRAKSIRFTSGSMQLDFFDAGLIPALEDLVHEKLDRLLRDVIASCKSAYKEHHDNELDYRALFRLIFRLVAAKLLGDRQYPGNWLNSNTQQVIRAVEDFYFQHTPPEAVLEDTYVQDMAWRKVRTAFSFRNLSVEALAYVYENTLVSPETRKKYGTHATAYAIAEYIVQSLPFEEFAPEERQVFEPFAGHAPFLIATLGRLRSLLPQSMHSQQRHDYFVQMLSGMELDAFACEVARYSLILADYPNPNGWHIENDNVFTSFVLDRYLAQTGIVLCNPPYEDFTFEERQLHSPLYSVNRAVEALSRILQYQPKMLGFVLPRSFIDGHMYRQARQQIADLYDNVSLIVLPDMAFHHSEAETVLLIAHGKRTSRPVWISAFVTRKDYQQFVYTGEPSWHIEVPVSFVEKQINSTLWYTPMQPIWDALTDLPHLGDVAEIHRGIEYIVPFDENKASLVSDTERPGFVKGLIRVTDDFEPYTINSFLYLNTDPKLMRGNAYQHRWERPKIIANAARLSRGPWTIAAAIDEQGLVCYQRFHGIWPKGDMPLEVMAALLNGPVANAFVSTQRTSRDNKIEIIKRIPIPKLNPSQIQLIVSLVREYCFYRTQWQKQAERAEYFEHLCRGIIRQIDAELLAAYDVPAHLERELFKYFDAYERPGSVPLTQIKPSPTKRLYTSIIRVENIKNEDGNKMIEAVVINWDPRQTVYLPMSLIPTNLQERLDRDTRLLAKVNVGARKAEDLIFEDIKLASESDSNDRLS